MFFRLKGLIFLHRLSLFGVRSKVKCTFYNALLKSLIRFVLGAWFGLLTLKSKSIRLVQLLTIQPVSFSRVHVVTLWERHYSARVDFIIVLKMAAGSKLQCELHAVAESCMDT